MKETDQLTNYNKDKASFWASKMAQRARALAAKLDGLNLICRIHIAGEN